MKKSRRRWYKYYPNWFLIALISLLNVSGIRINREVFSALTKLFRASISKWWWKFANIRRMMRKDLFYPQQHLKNRSGLFRNQDRSLWFIVDLKVQNLYFVFISGLFGCCASAANFGHIQAPRFITQPSASGSIVAEGRTKILQCQALGKCCSKIR